MAAEIRLPVVAAVKAKANVNEYENAHVHEIHASIVSESLEFLENEQTKTKEKYNEKQNKKQNKQNKKETKQQQEQQQFKQQRSKDIFLIIVLSPPS